MKFISWNVNGIRACIKKGFWDYFAIEDADFFCIQESKISDGQVDFSSLNYYQYYNYAVKKGYSGTIIFAKKQALNVSYGIGIEEHDQEGRVITLEYDNFYLVNVYTPNSKDGLLRLDYRQLWEDDFREYLTKLKQKKSVILCGDLNVAHQEIDLKNPKTNTRNAGFTIEERTKFSNLLEQGFIDSFRFLHPNEIKYSWWSYRAAARTRNVGWRIDYFVVSEDLKDKIKFADIDDQILGSDHAPVKLIIEL